MDKTKFSKSRKAAIATLCAVAVTCTALSAACKPNNGGNNGSSSNPSKEDTQLLKNGDFEYFDVPENAVYLIRSVNNWSRSGDSSGAMSGIINTSTESWKQMTATDLKAKLDANNDLSVGDSDYDDKYVDYNGMDSGDILYIEPYAASISDANKIGDDDNGFAKDGVILGGGKQAQRSYREFLGIERSGNENEGYTYTFKGEPVYLDPDSGDYYFEEDFVNPVRYAIVDNPETHLGEYNEKDGKHYLGTTEILVDEDGNYYIDTNGNGKVDKLEDQSVGNVLMVHNYPTNSKYNGIEQHYSSQSITLEANTAAEISLWVKTSDLKFDKGYVLDENQQDRGAYIEVTQSVASNTIDSFKIKAINTEKIIANNPALDTNNGWLKYTIYVNACDFANSTIKINLGLGDSETTRKVTGYAFFDDVEVKKYIDFGDDNSSYADNESKIWPTSGPASYCSLTSDEEEKIFYADKQIRGGVDERYSNRFHYFVDLASEKITDDTKKNAIAFDDSELNISTALTTSESSGKIYASAETNGATVSGVKKVTKPDSKEKYDLPDSMKYEGGRPTFNDLIGIYNSDTVFEESFFTGKDDSGKNLQLYDPSESLNAALSGASGIEAISKFCISDSNSMLVMFSAYGAAYTTTIENKNDQGAFTVQGTANSDGLSYKILSFWIKTSDMDGSTAATVKLIDANDDDNNASIVLDTTKIKTDVGDDKDIYSGWVQCFFFVKNEQKEAMNFKLEFSFGNTDIAGTSGTSYKSGWAAMANIQSLDVDEDVFKIVSEGTYAKMLTFSEDAKKTGNSFDDANKMTNIKNGVATPGKYYGVNGGSSYVSDKEFGDDFDKQNNVKNSLSGLINRDYFSEKYAESLQKEIISAFGGGSFTDAAKAWNDIFGEECYQPLIIVDSLREYYDRVIADKEYIKEHIDEFYIKTADGKYVSAAGSEYDENETYYSARQVAKNFGYIGESKTISPDSYTTISVKVMVSGNATAWVYLVDTTNYDLLDFELPEYTYYYDDEGNVLSEKYDKDWSDADHRAAIVYDLRDDGLYDGKDGGVYANLSNIAKKFKFKQFEHNTFYTAEGTTVNYDELEDGVTYYDENGKVASHYLCVGSQRVYEYDAATETYYYLVEGERSVAVKDFSHEYARYAAADIAKPEYAVKVTNTNGKWITVNFVIATGENDKEYRLELWNGERGSTGAEDLTFETDAQFEAAAAAINGKGAVAFDYSSYSITGSNYSDVLGEYESAIKNAYIGLIADADESKVTAEDLTKLNINELKAIVEELEISAADIETAFEGIDKNYVAEYYTFSWYDSASYVPFNFETAKAGQTGYNYTASSYSEKLIYFKTCDYAADNTVEAYNLFVDYSAVDKTIDIASNGGDNDHDNDHDHDHTDSEGQSPWLLITSIVLVAVLLFALLAIFARYLWKKYAKKRDMKNMQKNNYKKRERYIRKLKLVKNEAVEEETPEEKTPEEEAPAEETPVEKTSVEEAPAEETPVEETPVEEAPAEETPAKETPVEEVPAEETSTEEAPAESENKDE